MDLFTENSPETCSSLGLDCGDCIHRAGATVARISSLEPNGVLKIFFQLYPSPGCRHMAHAFEMAYRQSSTTHKTVVKFTTAAA